VYNYTGTADLLQLRFIKTCLQNTSQMTTSRIYNPLTLKAKYVLDQINGRTILLRDIGVKHLIAIYVILFGNLYILTYL